MYALILETLSSTELLFILVIALIFFGPRRLPQLARSIGKGMAEFRKASEDFKRTWEREVAMETAKLQSEAHSILDMEGSDYESTTTAEPYVEPADSSLVVARESSTSNAAGESVPAAETNAQATPNSRKHDWL
ncbi:MAG TPA: twin-arginine translocase TatA/TatE family subunit [Pyrinomonadaceae bacterium]